MNRIKKSNLILAENLVEDIMDKFEACGIAAAIIDGNGNTAFEKFWGVRDQESGKRRYYFRNCLCDKILYQPGHYAAGREGNP